MTVLVYGYVWNGVWRQLKVALGTYGILLERPGFLIGRFLGE